MVTYEGTIEGLKRTLCHNNGHNLIVFQNSDGGYLVTCACCDLWTTIPSGERLRGWDNDAVMKQAEA